MDLFKNIDLKSLWKHYSDPAVTERTDIAFMGTLVRDGHGSGIVVATAGQTVFGSVFEMMSDIEKPKTPLQQAMDKLGKDLSIFSFIVIGIICLIGIFQGRSWLDQIFVTTPDILLRVRNTLGTQVILPLLNACPILVWKI